MADATYNSKVYHKHGGDELVVASGGTIRNQGSAYNVQSTPNAKTVAVTLTIANLLTKIITGTHTAGATAAYTLPTGTNVENGVTMEVNDSFDWCLINLSAAAVDTITVTAGTGHTKLLVILLCNQRILRPANFMAVRLYGEREKPQRIHLYRIA